MIDIHNRTTCRTENSVQNAGGAGVLGGFLRVLKNEIPNKGLREVIDVWGWEASKKE